MPFGTFYSECINFFLEAGRKPDVLVFWLGLLRKKG
jgi:hypothetical protein